MLLRPLELAQCTGFNLAHAIFGQFKHMSNLLERPSVAPLQSVAQAKDFPLQRMKRGEQRLVNLLLKKSSFQKVLRLRRLIRDQVKPCLKGQGAWGVSDLSTELSIAEQATVLASGGTATRQAMELAVGTDPFIALAKHTLSSDVRLFTKQGASNEISSRDEVSARRSFACGPCEAISVASRAGSAAALLRLRQGGIFFGADCGMAHTWDMRSEAASSSSEGCLPSFKKKFVRVLRIEFTQSFM
eukprot:scaffold41175_cov33-Tisochrysis_lutea.AAC.3